MWTQPVCLTDLWEIPSHKQVTILEFFGLSFSFFRWYIFFFSFFFLRQSKPLCSTTGSLPQCSHLRMLKKLISFRIMWCLTGNHGHSPLIYQGSESRKGVEDKCHVTWYPPTLTISFKAVLWWWSNVPWQTDTSALTQFWPQAQMLLASFLQTASEQKKKKNYARCQGKKERVGETSVELPVLVGQGQTEAHQNPLLRESKISPTLPWGWSGAERKEAPRDQDHDTCFQRDAWGISSEQDQVSHQKVWQSACPSLKPGWH